MAIFERLQKYTMKNGLLHPDNSKRAATQPAYRSPKLTWSNRSGRNFIESCGRRLPAPALCPFGGACHACPARVQAKLTVSQANDPYEQEADRVAYQVMSMPEPRVQRACPSCEDETLQKKPLADQITPLVQRQEETPEEEEEPVQAKSEEEAVKRKEVPEEEEEPVQAKREANFSVKQTHSLEKQIHSLRGYGQPLPQTTRDFFESRYRRDFADVRIHSGPMVSKVSETINAQAFTLGRDIFFRQRNYSPETQEGKKLLAHELTHTLQQRGASSLVQRTVSATAQPDFQSNPKAAKVCLIHLHADEQNAFALAQDIRSRYCANLVFVKNPIQNRCIEVARLSRGRSCMADPNRIFSSKTVTEKCAFGSCNCDGLPKGPTGACSCNSSLKSEAAQDIHGSFRSDLIGAINQCRGGQGRDSFDTSSNLLPIIAFHNNVSFNIKEYRPGGSDAWAAATMKEIKSLAKARNIALPKGIKNPSVSTAQKGNPKSANYHNFYLTTDINDFLNLRAQNYNVVLQSPSPRKITGKRCSKDDGSLSIALGGARYINIETYEKNSNIKIDAFTTSMAETALNSLGIPKGTCPSPSKSGTLKTTPLPASRIQRHEKTPAEEGPFQAESEEEPVRRQEENEEGRGEEPVQAEQESNHTPRLTPALDRQIRSLRGGSPLPSAARSFFERRFGSDFSGVRVHAGNAAAEAARGVNAKAFTVGREIVFGQGQYSPDAPGGQRLLAHELTHVIQQTDVAEAPSGSDSPSLQRQTAAPQPAPQYGKPCSGNSAGSTDPCQKLRCTTPQLTIIRKDVIRAIGYVNSALISLLPPISDDSRQAMDWYMGSHDDGTVATVTKRLGEILTALQDTRDIDRIGCDPDDSNAAYTCAGGHTIDTDCYSPICITDKYFGGSERMRTQTIIHECAHRVGMAVGEPTNFDDIYRWSARFMFLSTDEALQNSDSYALLAGAIVGGIPLSYFPHAALGTGAATSAAGGTTWQASLHVDMEFQHPLLGFFNPTLGFGMTLIGETTAGGQTPVSSPLSMLNSLLFGFRIENPRPGSAGGLYLSLFGGPALAVQLQPGGSAFLGAEAGMALGYRWRFLDISAGISYAYDPARLPGMENMALSSFNLSFVPFVY